MSWRMLINVGFLFALFAGWQRDAVGAVDLLVEATVEPFVSVRPVSNLARIGTVGAGGIDAELPFFIESNSARVSVQLLVTHLYKDENPALQAFLPVDDAAGIEVRTETARSVDGDLQMRFVGTDNLSKRLGVFAAHKSETLHLEVPGQALFNEEVDFYINWIRSQRLMPSGVYRGFVVITVMAL